MCKWPTQPKLSHALFSNNHIVLDSDTKTCQYLDTDFYQPGCNIALMRYSCEIRLGHQILSQKMCSLLLGAIVIEIKFIIVPVQRHYSPFNKKFDMSNKLSNCSQVARKIVWYLSIELSCWLIRRHSGSTNQEAECVDQLGAPSDHILLSDFNLELPQSQTSLRSNAKSSVAD